MNQQNEKVDPETGEVISAVPIVRQDAQMAEVVSRAEIDTQIATAKRFPRTITQFKARLMNLATMDVETAMSCFYSFPRGGKQIEGPSIRLAELAASAWQNLRVEGRMTGEDEKWVYAEGAAWDLENNVAWKAPARRRITDKDSVRYSDDMVGVTSGAAAAVAMRNAVLKVVPRSFINPIYEKCREVSMGTAQTLANRRAKMTEWFNKLGVSTERIMAYLEREGVDDVTLEDIAKLAGMATALKEGHTTVEEAFPAPPADMPDGDGKKMGFGKKKGAEAETPDEEPRPKKKTGKKSKKSAKPKESEKPEEPETSESPEEPAEPDPESPVGGPDLTKERQRQLDALAAEQEAENEAGPADPGAPGPEDDPAPPDEEPTAADDDNEALF